MGQQENGCQGSVFFRTRRCDHLEAMSVSRRCFGDGHGSACLSGAPARAIHYNPRMPSTLVLTCTVAALAGTWDHCGPSAVARLRPACPCTDAAVFGPSILPIESGREITQKYRKHARGAKKCILRMGSLAVSRQHHESLGCDQEPLSPRSLQALAKRTCQCSESHACRSPQAPDPNFTVRACGSSCRARASKE